MKLAVDVETCGVICDDADDPKDGKAGRVAEAMVANGFNTIAALWDASYLKDKKLAATLPLPCIIVPFLHGEGEPKPGDDVWELAKPISWL